MHKIKYVTTQRLQGENTDQLKIGISAIRSHILYNNTGAIHIILQDCIENQCWRALDRLLYLLMGEGYERLSLRERLTLYQMNITDE